MVTVSIVNSKEILNNLRFDAEYYKPEFLKVINKLKRLGSEKLENIVGYNSIKKGIFYILAEEYRPKGIPFIRVSNIGNPFIEKKDLVYISYETNEKHKSTSLKPGDIVISKGGTIGFVAIITPDIGICNISQDVIGVKNIPYKKISSYYLVIFLLTKYGQLQLMRGRSQQVQAHLTLDAIRNILVPIIDRKIQQYIEGLVKQAYEKRVLSEKKYQKAEKKLYEFLGIDREEIEKLETEKAYETNFIYVKQAFRFDAEYYHPKYLRIVDFLKRTPFEIKKLNEVVRISNEKINPTREPYKTKKLRYVPIAKIRESGEIYEWEEFYGWQAPSRARMVIRKGDILVPSLAGTFDKVAIVPEELDNQLATTGCFVVRVPEGYPEFFFLLFRTPLFKNQLERYTTGAIMSAVPRKVFENILVPDVPRDAQAEIAELVKEYFKLRRESRMLIQEAIRKVEEVIENESANSSDR